MERKYYESRISELETKLESLLKEYSDISSYKRNKTYSVKHFSDWEISYHKIREFDEDTKKRKELVEAINKVGQLVYHNKKYINCTAWIKEDEGLFGKYICLTFKGTVIKKDINKPASHPWEYNVFDLENLKVEDIVEV